MGQLFHTRAGKIVGPCNFLLGRVWECLASPRHTCPGIPERRMAEPFTRGGRWSACRLDEGVARLDGRYGVGGPDGGGGLMSLEGRCGLVEPVVHAPSAQGR